MGRNNNRKMERDVSFYFFFFFFWPFLNLMNAPAGPTLFNINKPKITLQAFSEAYIVL